MSTEAEKPIPGWPEYTCSADGVIKRISKACGATPGRPLKWTVMSNGYAKVALCRDAKRKEMLVHRIVASTFICDPLPDGMDVCHFDGNKLNNTVANLRIDTRKGNMGDQIRMGKTPRGERCGSNVHTKGEILEIRRLFKGGMKQAEIARMFKVRPQYVHNVVKGYIWGWL